MTEEKLLNELEELENIIKYHECMANPQNNTANHYIKSYKNKRIWSGGSKYHYIKTDIVRSYLAYVERLWGQKFSDYDPDYDRSIPAMYIEQIKETDGKWTLKKSNSNAILWTHNIKTIRNAFDQTSQKKLNLSYAGDHPHVPGVPLDSNKFVYKLLFRN